MSSSIEGQLDDAVEHEEVTSIALGVVAMDVGDNSGYGLKLETEFICILLFHLSFDNFDASVMGDEEEDKVDGNFFQNRGFVNMEGLLWREELRSSANALGGIGEVSSSSRHWYDFFPIFMSFFCHPNLLSVEELLTGDSFMFLIFCDRWLVENILVL